MKKIIVLAMLALAGCVDWTVDGRIDERESQRIAGALGVLEAQRAAWNAAGYDPLRVSPAALSLASLACGSLSMAGALAEPSIGEHALKVCDAALRIAAPAPSL